MYILACFPLNSRVFFCLLALVLLIFNYLDLVSVKLYLFHTGLQLMGRSVVELGEVKMLRYFLLNSALLNRCGKIEGEYKP